MEEALLLIPVHRDIRGIEVQNQALGRPPVVGNEPVKEHFVEVRRHRATLLLLRAAQGSGTDERFQTLASGLEGTAETQLVVAVYVLKAASDRQQPLSHQLFGAVLNPSRISRIIDGIGHEAG